MVWAARVKDQNQFRLDPGQIRADCSCGGSHVGSDVGSDVGSHVGSDVGSGLNLSEFG